MRRILGLMAVLFVSFCGIASAQAGVDVKVDIAAQRMTVTTSEGEVYNWAISSGRQGFRSPNGVYRPTRLEKNWYSRKYGGAMPYAVFFRGGYAIHGTSSVGALGRPASHGCIRLHPANAAKFFALVKKHGSSQTRIALNGAATDNLSRFAKAAQPRKATLAQAPVIAAVATVFRGETLLVPARTARAQIVGGTTARTQLVKAEITSAKIAKVNFAKAKIANAKIANTKIAKARSHRHQSLGIAQQRRGGAGWEAARGQILLRPALPASAYGYQPYGPSGYVYGPGWR